MVVLTEVSNMFWGVTVDGGKRYTQTVEHGFHISMAALEPKDGKASQGPVSVMIQHDKAEFLLCTLEQGKLYQQTLDLNFTEGEEVTFFLNGKGTGVVHLTGYLVEEDQEMPNFGMEDSMEDFSEEDVSDEEDDDEEDDEEEDDDEEEEESDEDVPRLKPITMGDMEDDDDEDDSEDEDFIITEDTGKRKKGADKEKTNKKQKLFPEEEDDDEDDDDEDDSDEDVIYYSTSEEEEEEKSPSPVKAIPGKNKDKTPGKKGDKSPGKKDEKTPGKQEKTPGKKEKTPGKQEKTPGKQGEKTPGKKADKTPVKNAQKSPEKKKAVGAGGDAGSPKAAMNGDHAKTPAQQNSTDTPASKKKNKKKNKGGETPAGQTPGKQEGQQKGGDQKTPGAKTPKTPKKKVLEGGVVCEEVKEGHGPEAKKGKRVHVNYTGRLPNGKVFDSATKKPFLFRLGIQEVIKGWDIGVAGMKVGGKRKLTIPPKFAYGNKALPGIPSNSTLVFDVELKAVS